MINKQNLNKMKTLAEHIKESQLTANAIRSELNRGIIVYLTVNNRTENSVVTSNPGYWGSARVSGSLGVIAGDEDGRYGDTYSLPVDQIDSVEQLDRQF